MNPEIPMLHMSIWDNVGVIIVIILVVLFDVIVPILKKRRAKQIPIDYEPREPEVFEPPVPVQDDPFQAVPAVRPKPRTRPSLPQAARPQRGNRLQTAFSGALAPLRGTAEVDAVLDSSHFAGQIEAVSKSATFPAWLVDGVTVAFAQLARQVPQFRDQMLDAAYETLPTGEISRVDELTTNSEKLAVGWAELLVVDALGLSLLGPTYAWARLQRLKEAGLIDVLDLNVAGGQDLLLNPPASVMRPVFLSGLQQLGYSRGASRVKEATADIQDHVAEVVLRLHGMGPAVQMPIPAPPLRSYTRSALTALVNTKTDALGNRRLVDICQRGGLPTQHRQGQALVGQLGESALPPTLELYHLHALAELALLRGPNAARAALLVRRTRPVAQKATQSIRSGDFEVSGQAIAEGLILGEVLRRR